MWGHINLGMLAAYKIGSLLRVFEVYRVLTHSYREGSDRFIAFSCRYGAYKRGIKPSGQQEAHLGVRNKSFFHSGNQLVVNFRTDRLKRIRNIFFHRGNIAVRYEFAVNIVMPRRERHYPAGKTDKVFRLAREYYRACLIVPVIKRAYPYRVPRRYVFSAFPVIYNAGELGVEHGEHIGAVFLIKRQYYLAVAVAFKAVTHSPQLRPCFLKAVKLAVADRVAAVKAKGLHTRIGQPHYGKSVKA